MERLYLYLARRDKKGVKVLTVLGNSTSTHISPVRMSDLTILQLAHEVKAELETLIHDNRMEWEPWMESAKSYQELRASLEKRGYANVPIHSMPLAESTNLHKPHEANTSKVPASRVMLQKPKRRW